MSLHSQLKCSGLKCKPSNLIMQAFGALSKWKHTNMSPTINKWSDSTRWRSPSTGKIYESDNIW